MAPTIYDIKYLRHTYGSRQALSIDRLTVKPSSIIGLIGPNGSGKSTLLRLLGLIEKPTMGKILFNGYPAEPFSDGARFQITLLPQEPFLMKRSVFNNVAYGLKLRGQSEDIETRVNKALSLVGLAGKDFIRRPWYALSGGETQRVALAARLVLEPKVLLLDEPTSNVDAASAQLIREAVINAKQNLGTTLIVASHDWQWLYEVCDEILHMFQGRIYGTGRETVILGPWRKLSSGLWGKKLKGNQYIMVTEPPHKGAAAVIDVNTISENDSRINSNERLLSGTISRISLEKATGNLFATVMVENQIFTIKLSAEQSRGRTLFPGMNIFLHYYPERVKWI